MSAQGTNPTPESLPPVSTKLTAAHYKIMGAVVVAFMLVLIIGVALSGPVERSIETCDDAFVEAVGDGYGGSRADFYRTCRNMTGLP